MQTLYVLQLARAKWYVGKTPNLARRFEQHRRGTGAVWTREYPPIRIAETRTIRSMFDETTVTKEYMKKYGIENVRGGAYTTRVLPAVQKDVIRHELRSASDACYACGRRGHFANRCRVKTDVSCQR